MTEKSNQDQKKTETSEIPKEIILQASMLEEGEMLIYVNKKGEKHVFSPSPYDSSKVYNELYMTDDDLGG